MNKVDIQIMKKCLWCLKTEQETAFEKKAHSIPKALGGQNYCINVCDVMVILVINMNINTQLKKQYLALQDGVLLQGHLPKDK